MQCNSLVQKIQMAPESRKSMGPDFRGLARASWRIAASIVLALGVGTAGGWFLRGVPAEPRDLDAPELGSTIPLQSLSDVLSL
jgi:hypothetical protein